MGVVEIIQPLVSFVCSPTHSARFDKKKFEKGLKCMDDSARYQKSMYEKCNQLECLQTPNISIFNFQFSVFPLFLLFLFFGSHNLEIICSNYGFRLRNSSISIFSNTGFSTISTVVVYAFIIVVTLTLRDVAKIESNHSH